MKKTVINNVEHVILTAPLKWNTLKTVEFVHPLGTVYVRGKFGYVANGYDWLRFPLVFNNRSL